MSVLVVLPCTRIMDHSGTNRRLGNMNSSATAAQAAR